MEGTVRVAPTSGAGNVDGIGVKFIVQNVGGDRIEATIDDEARASTGKWI
jgi:hypothetical protein